MIYALYIYMICLMLLVKDLPVWLDIICFIIGVVSCVISMVLWDMDKNKIKLLERRITKLEEKPNENHTE